MLDHRAGTPTLVHRTTRLRRESALTRILSTLEEKETAIQRLGGTGDGDDKAKAVEHEHEPAPCRDVMLRLELGAQREARGRSSL